MRLATSSAGAAGTAEEYLGWVRGHWGIGDPRSDDPRSDNLLRRRTDRLPSPWRPCSLAWPRGFVSDSDHGGNASCSSMSRSVCPPPFSARPPDPMTAIWSALPMERRRRLQRLLADLLARPVIIGAAPAAERPMTARPRIDPPPSPKLRSWHLDRSAFVYVRQSTPQQVTRPPRNPPPAEYALADRAPSPWAGRGPQIQVIDDDLGKSGQSDRGAPREFQLPAARRGGPRSRRADPRPGDESPGAVPARTGTTCSSSAPRFRVLLADADGDPTTRRSTRGSPGPRSHRDDERSRSCISSNRGCIKGS